MREPLLHFLLLGAALFAVYGWAGGGAARDVRRPEVRVVEADVTWLRETWTRQWLREPTDDEMRRLVTEHLQEQLLAREAREMGLDEDDVYVRRRLAQKVDFVLADTSRLAEPTDDELRAFHAARAAWFSGATRTTFTHVFFTDAHRAEAVAARARLEAGGNPFDLGDPILVDAEQREVTREDVAAQFGAAFAAALAALPVGGWHGPIESGYGLHVVRVASRSEGAVLPFEEARARVAERWRDERQRDDRERFFARLLQKYDVVLDAAARPWVDLSGTAGRRDP
ncbi:MAG: peptidyl-prolyl cis-trans isomerase [Planctomycetia bacterium]|nr:peptidyl-prolyl cis-trans isomerase [Planctomycetia bacterium]